jgi:glycosyltransferase involved in cell wall biosynthesis
MPTVLVNARHLGDDAIGYGQYARQLLQAFSAYGAAFEYVFAAPVCPDGLDIANLSSHVRLRVIPWVRFPSRGARIAYWDTISFPRFAHPLKPALVHQLAPCITPFNTPTVTTVHDVIEARFPRSLPHSLYFHMAIRKALKSECVCAVSESARDDLAKATGLPPERIVVVHHGHNPAHLNLPRCPLPQAGHFRALHGRPYFLYVGSDYPYKNLQRLLLAFGKVQAVASECRLALCGRAFDAGRWHSAHHPGVVPIGYVTEDEKLALYQNARALVLPSLVEGFGLPVLEALTAGCAVVASGIRAVKEIAGESAIFFDPYDTESLAEALLRALREPGVIEHLRRQGPDRARLFDWRDTVSKLEQVYQGVIQSPVRKR